MEKRPNLPFLSSLLLAISALALPAAAPAQAPFPFTIQVRQADTVTNIGDGGTVLMQAPALGMETTASFTITYNDPTATNIKAIELTGSTDFSLSSPATPFPLDRGQSFAMTARYLPGESTVKEAVITVTYTAEAGDVAFTINLNGTAPEFAYTFAPAGGNAAQVMPGETLAFPETALEAVSRGAFTVTNRGTAPGAVNAVRTTGPFAALGLPLLPVELAPGAEMGFTIEFVPQALGVLDGALSLELAGGAASFPLEGTGTGAQFVYEVIEEGQARPIAPNATINLPDTPVRETASVVISVRNEGNADGVIQTIQVTGAGFSLSELPFLPATVAPGQTVTLTLNFTPAEIGPHTGRLKIGEAEFDLSGEGVGAFLEFSVTIDGTTEAVEEGGAVLFPPTMVGAAATAVFLVRNAGSEEAAIRSIALAAGGGAFELADLPALPLALPAGAAAEFTIVFRPQIEGPAAVTLLVNTASFSLSGTGTAPAPLAGYRFEGASGTQPPRSQPAIGLALTEPYPLKVVGALTLSFASDAFADDPSVQFSTGGRKVEFEIPAGETAAVFPNGTTRVKVQTGTVAGAIVLTPTFATEGGAELTPDSPAVQTLTVLPAAPVITSLVIAEKRLSSMVLEITGYATSREVTRIGLSFQARAGENLGTTSLTIDAGAQFGAWYQNAQSAQFGSQFTVVVPLSFSGATNSVSGQTNAVASITATLENSLGKSAAVTIENPQ